MKRDYDNEAWSWLAGAIGLGSGLLVLPIVMSEPVMPHASLVSINNWNAIIFIIGISAILLYFWGFKDEED